MPVIARFRDLPGAEVASATLEAAGIVNTLWDANMIAVVWTDSTALGWVKVFVAEADAEEARALLEPPDAIEWPAELAELPAGERCPFCGSDELALESGPRRALAVMICLSLPVWLWRSRLRCRACGKGPRVPLRFRPELLLAWGIAAVGVALVLAIGMLALSFLLTTLAKISH